MRKIIKKFLCFFILFVLLFYFLFSQGEHDSPQILLAAVVLGITFSFVGTYSEIRFFRAFLTPLKIREKQRSVEGSGEEVQTEFTSRDRALWILDVFMFVLLIIFSIVIVFKKPGEWFYYYFFSIPWVISLSLEIIGHFYNRLIVSAEGITCRFPLYQVHVNWEEIKQIEYHDPAGWMISCRSSKVKALPIVAWWLKFMENDRIVPLDLFAPKFARSKLLKAIHYYAPDMRYMTSE